MTLLTNMGAWVRAAIAPKKKPKGKDRIITFVIAATDTLKELLILYAVVLLISAFFISMFEGLSYWDSLWFASVAAPSTGFGDITPKTVGGRVTAMILMHITVLFVIPLVTARFASRLIVDSDAFTHEEQEELKQLLRDAKAEAEKANQEREEIRALLEDIRKNQLREAA